MILEPASNHAEMIARAHDKRLAIPACATTACVMLASAETTQEKLIARSAALEALGEIFGHDVAAQIATQHEFQISNK